MSALLLDQVPMAPVVQGCNSAQPDANAPGDRGPGNKPPPSTQQPLSPAASYVSLATAFVAPPPPVSLPRPGCHRHPLCVSLTRGVFCPVLRVPGVCFGPNGGLSDEEGGFLDGTMPSTLLSFPPCLSVCLSVKFNNYFTGSFSF